MCLRSKMRKDYGTQQDISPRDECLDVGRYRTAGCNATRLPSGSFRRGRPPRIGTGLALALSRWIGRRKLPMHVEP